MAAKRREVLHVIQFYVIEHASLKAILLASWSVENLLLEGLLDTGLVMQHAHFEEHPTCVNGQPTVK